MKIQFNKFFKTTILGGAICIVVLLFASCENFLNAHDTAEQIKEAIEIANSNYVTIYIENEKDTGTLNLTQVKVKKKESFKLKFTPSDNWRFIEWEVLNRETGEPVVDCIKFDNAKNLEVKCTLLTSKENLLIYPKCFRLPSVISATPASSETAYANTPIVIKFNMPIEDENILAKDSIINYGYQNINIVCELFNMTDYFEAPELNTDKTVLTIMPKSSELKNFIQTQKRPFIDLQISFGENFTVKKDGTILPMAPDSKSFSVRYKDEIEKNPPEKFEFFASTHEITIASAASTPLKNMFNQDDIAEIDPEDNTPQDKIIQNRSNGTIYIYGKYYDAESGVKTITITELQTHEWEYCTEVDAQEYNHSYTVNMRYENAEFMNDGKGITFFCIKQVLDSDDGAVLVNVKIEDACGNPAKLQTFTVIKRSSICLEDFQGIYNVSSDYFTLDFDIDDYYEKARNIKITNVALNDYDAYNIDSYPAYSLCEIVYGYTYITGESFSLFCEYKDKNGIVRREPFSPYDPETRTWNLSLNVGSLIDLPIKIIVIDDIGLEGEIEFKFPPALVSQIVSQSSSGKTVLFSSDSGEFFYNTKLLEYTADGVLENVKQTSSYTSTVYIKSEYNYSAVPINMYLYGEVISINPESVPDVVVTGYSLSKSVETNRSIDIALNIAEDSWQKYDSICFDYSFYSVDNLKPSAFNHYYIKGETSCIFTVDTKDLYSRNLNIKVFGKKNSSISKGTSYTIQPITSIEYDNVPPSISYNQEEYDYYTFSMSDIGSGSDYGKVTIGGNEFTINENSGFTAKVPVWVINESVFISEEGHPLWEFELYDKNGNSFSGTDYILVRNVPIFKTITKTENEKWCLDTGEFSKSDYSDYYTRWLLDIYVLGTDSKWAQSSRTKYDATRTELSDNMIEVTISDITLPADSFIRINNGYFYYGVSGDESQDKFSFGTPFYVYTGEARNGDGKYDLLLANGNSNDSVAISSDGPVFIHTLVTTKPYSECSSWNVIEWETNHKHIGDKYIDFSTDIRNQRYNIPMGEITKGECYVVVAHFANGNSLMSEVMQK